MSLIQEALKRQRDDSAGNNPAQPGGGVPPPRAPGAPQFVPPQSGPGGPPPLASAMAPPLDASAGSPTSPPPLTEEVLEDQETKSRSWITLVGVVLIVLLLGAGGVWLVIFAFQKWGPSSGKEPAVASQTAPATSGTPATPDVTATTPVAPGVTPVASATMPNATQSAAPTVSPATGTPGALPVADSSGTPGLDPNAGVAWPFLRITGIAGKGVRGAATINGKVLSVGDFIDGAEVISIGDYGVRMEFEGETRFVRVGAAGE